MNYIHFVKCFCEFFSIFFKVEAITHNIKALRKHFNLTQDELAQRINNKRDNITSWETGKAKPSVEIIKIICEKFQIDVKDFLSMELDATYFNSLQDRPAIYYNSNSESARELIEFLQEEIKEKNKIISQLLKIMNREPEK